MDTIMIERLVIPSLLTKSSVTKEEVPSEIQELLEKRDIARTTHNWPEADLLREAINLKGYVVEDTPQGQKISKS